MECRRTDDLLSAYLDGDLPERERAGFAEHLRQCPRCAGEEKALKDTLSLLRNLPAVHAPSGLLEGVRRRIGEETEEPPLWRKLVLPSRFGIPLGAAAAVLIFLLVYGIQREIPVAKVPRSSPGKEEMKVAKASPPPATAVESEIPPESAVRQPARRMTGSSPMSPEAVSGRDGAAKPVSAESGKSVPAETERSDVGPPSSVSSPVLAKSEIPAGLASRVSTSNETIEPAIPRESPAGEAREPGVPGGQLARLQRPPPYGKEVTVEVAPDDRAGMEDRISALALRLGGGIRRGGAFTASGETGKVTILGEILQVSIPAASEGTFLEELGKMGTIPHEETTGKTDLSGGSSSDTVTYTVRIRVQ